MTSPTSAPTNQFSGAAALFEDESQARQAVQALHEQGVADQLISLFAPGPADANMSSVLRDRGMSEGETRFYAQEVQAGRTLVVVDPKSNLAAGRDLLLSFGGYDVRSRGAELARAEGAGVAGGTGAQPVDLTDEWDDVASRYEMLWAQHYGTTNQTWEQVQPVYRWAWQAANDARYRGRPWSEAAYSVHQDWDSSSGTPAWAEVEGPVRDVWEDVAEEAALGAEGGQDRRIASQGTDQSVAARNVE